MSTYSEELSSRLETRRPLRNWNGQVDPCLRNPDFKSGSTYSNEHENENSSFSTPRNKRPALVLFNPSVLSPVPPPVSFPVHDDELQVDFAEPRPGDVTSFDSDDESDDEELREGDVTGFDSDDDLDDDEENYDPSFSDETNRILDKIQKKMASLQVDETPSSEYNGDTNIDSPDELEWNETVETDVHETVATVGTGTESKPKKKKKKESFPWVVPEIPNGGKAKYFSVDIELSGPIRNFDRIVEIGAVAFDDDFKILGRFDQRVNPAGVAVTEAAFRVHKISTKDLANCPKFDIVGKRFCAFMDSFLGPNDHGILVAHHGNACDFQFLCCEMLRHGIEWPARVKYTIDTLELIRRFPHLDYHGYDTDAWPVRTAQAGRPSMSLRPIVEFLLKHPERIKLHGPDFDVTKRNQSFESVCGDPHKALPDALGGAIILSDKKGVASGFGRLGLCHSLENHLLLAREVMAKSAIVHEPVPDKWTEYEDGSDPPYVENMPEHSPLPGMTPGPTPFLKDSLGIQEGAEVEPIELLVRIFNFYFDQPLWEHVVKCTNAYATQQFVTVKDANGKVSYKGPPRTRLEVFLTRARCAMWKPLTIAELKVFHGIVIKMGVKNSKRISHCWSEEGNVGDPLIKSAMKENRFCEILANLSFMMPGDESIPKTDRLRKIRFVNDYLLRKVKSAMFPEQSSALDESMIHCCSIYCPFGQSMKSKPIKRGIKNFLLVDSSLYVHNWEVFLGKDGSSSTKGSYIFDLIFKRLIPPSWSQTGKVIYMDNYFVSIPLFTALRVIRGIFAVGPSAAKRPEKLENCNEKSVPFQTYKKTDARLVGGKGFMRHAVQKLEQGVLHATTWLDNRFLVMLSTVHAVKTSVTDTVLRWTASVQKRIPIRAPMSLINYVRNMGFVDRVDKSNALANIRIRRCQKRYHRQLWFWYVSTVGHHNAKVIWERLLGTEVVEALKKKHDHFGYTHWVQLKLGEELIRQGIKEAKQDCLASAAPDATVTPSPHFMPSRKRLCVRPESLVSPVPQCHQLVPINEIKVYNDQRNCVGTLPRTFCRVCLEKATLSGSGTKIKYVMPDGSPCPKPYLGCNKCKVCLCSEACHLQYDHVRNKVKPKMVKVD